ncbi:hypothetical protein DYU05_05180 [Mucilaginibacter terrenus]|uniref:Uncharacterized protein n=1 Tax=Mucilaginibacter terrenus TaxID=2482727 RepID=A0A3E2NVK5_9SPHI|nr:hypothetical protein [Mucilaginibacter terrenus]RFZ84999.1 hypothetical protein DYU05_05180 [Mucilaginibacter terrenus]
MKSKQVNDEAALLELKADELVSLLQKGVVDVARVKAIQQRVIIALDEASLPKKIEAFKEIDTNADRLDMLNSFEQLLSQHQLDTAVSKKYITRERVKKALVVVIGIIMITLGMAMIIMPAPPYFEMFTIFYFNDNDGVTIMDIISLLIVFTGVYLFLSAVLKKQTA